MTENRPALGLIEHQLREIIGQDCELHESGEKPTRGPLKSIGIDEQVYSGLTTRVLSFYLDYIATKEIEGWKITRKPITEEEEITGVLGFAIGTDYINLHKNDDGQINMHIPMVGNVIVH